MSKKKIVGSKFKIGDKVIIKNRPNPNRGELGFSEAYHYFDDGAIGVIVEDRNLIDTYQVKLKRDKSDRPLTQSIYERDLIKA